VAESRGASVLQLRIALERHEPEIWRRVLVPADVPLDRLHLILQAAMGWTNTHMHQFRIGGADYGSHLDDEDDWPDDELDDELDEVEFSLADLVGVGDRFAYEYDFGDAWEHEVVVEKATTVQPVLKFAVCLDGANACPPEDCGGSAGYTDLLAVLADPRHAEHEDASAWVGAGFDPGSIELAAVNAALQRVR
jgi:hypothetical protein